MISQAETVVFLSRVLTPDDIHLLHGCLRAWREVHYEHCSSDAPFPMAPSPSLPAFSSDEDLTLREQQRHESKTPSEDEIARDSTHVDRQGGGLAGRAVKSGFVTDHGDVECSKSFIPGYAGFIPRGAKRTYAAAASLPPAAWQGEPLQSAARWGRRPCPSRCTIQWGEAASPISTMR